MFASAAAGGPAQHQDCKNLDQIIEGEPKITLEQHRHSPGTAPDIPGTTPAWPKIDDDLPAGCPRPGQAGRPKRVPADAAAGN